ncbi:hypothetical protein BT69DRAFT_14575 [Atractiella rhizophila]|nr:hypothetical protein BT69DRAFT_14575 [Atractiella rhizophila]
MTTHMPIMCCCSICHFDRPSATAQGRGGPSSFSFLYHLQTHRSPLALRNFETFSKATHLKLSVGSICPTESCDGATASDFAAHFL